VTLDGVGNQIVISGFAAAITINEDGILLGKGNSSIKITDSGIFITGELTVGNGLLPPDSQLIAWNKAALAALGLLLPPPAKIAAAQYINVSAQK